MELDKNQEERNVFMRGNEPGQGMGKNERHAQKATVPALSRESSAGYGMMPGRTSSFGVTNLIGLLPLQRERAVGITTESY